MNENVPLWLRTLVEYVETIQSPLIWRSYVDKGGPECSVPCTASELACSREDLDPAQNWAWVVDVSPVSGTASYEIGHLLSGFEEYPEVHGSELTLDVRGKYRGINVILVFWYEDDGTEDDTDQAPERVSRYERLMRDDEDL